jgi:hypothetical protein
MNGFELGPFLWETLECAKYAPLSEKSFSRIAEIGYDDSEQDADDEDLQVLRLGGSLMDDDADDVVVEEEARQDHRADFRCDNDGGEQRDDVRDTGERRWRSPIDMENLQLPTLDF